MSRKLARCKDRIAIRVIQRSPKHVRLGNFDKFPTAWFVQRRFGVRAPPSKLHHNGTMIKKIPVRCDTQISIEACSRFLHRELSAIEIYETVINRFDGFPAVVELRQLEWAHRQSAALLHRRILRMCGIPEAEPEGWRRVSKALLETSRLLGGEGALDVLIKGERASKNFYLEALERADLQICCKDFIRDNLLTQACRNEMLLKALRARN